MDLAIQPASLRPITVTMTQIEHKTNHFRPRERDFGSIVLLFRALQLAFIKSEEENLTSLSSIF